MKRDANGRYRPGQSGNPAGRPRVAGQLRELMRELTPEAIEAVKQAVRNYHGDMRMAMEAAKLVLAYGYGKPPQAITGEEGEGPVEMVITWAGE